MERRPKIAPGRSHESTCETPFILRRRSPVIAALNTQMKKILVTFADSRLTKARNRFVKQALELAFFDQLKVFDEHMLDEDFKSRHRAHLKRGVRGFGFWCWKPQVILQALAEMEFGDALLYCDIGFHLNRNGLLRLGQYFDELAHDPIGVIGFQIGPPPEELHYDGRPLPSWPNSNWTKGDLLDYLRVRDANRILSRECIVAGAILIPKTDLAVHLIECWKGVFEHQFTLIDDSPSESPNVPSFIEHRHDQAIWSLLAKQHQIRTLSYFELWYPDAGGRGSDWTALANYPIHARRDLEVSLRDRMLTVLCRVWLRVVKWCSGKG